MIGAGLDTYSLMATAGCLTDPSSLSYCYVEAVANPNPSDVYFYQLPLDMSLPETSKPTCSACAKSLLSLYAAAKGDATEGLADTYAGAAGVGDGACGKAYAVASVGASPNAGRPLFGEPGRRWRSFLIAVICVVLAWS